MIVTTEISRTAVDTDKVEKIVRGLLDERFGDEFVFDPIEVRARVFDDGETAEDYLEIYIVVDADLKRLPSSWTSKLTLLMEPELLEMGWEFAVAKWFIEKPDWEEILTARKKNDRISGHP